MVLKRLPWIDYKLYRQRRYLVAVYMEFSKGRYWEGMSYARSFCPLCHYESKRANRMCWWNFSTGYVHCHACEVTTDALGMVCRLMKCEAVKACEWLEQKAGAAGSGFVPSEPSNIRRPKL